MLVMFFMISVLGKAQENIITVLTSKNSDPKSTTLNILLGEFYSLSLNKDNAIILLSSEDKFQNGSKSEVIEMTVFSSRKYSITTNASSTSFNGNYSKLIC